MSYKYLEHEADLGLEAKGSSLNKMFEYGAIGLFNAMSDIKKVKPLKSINIKCTADEISTLYIEFLNALLAQKDITGMLFSKFEVKVSEKKPFSLKAKCYGEKFDAKKHKAKTEVKAASYFGLKYVHDKDYKITCVLDL